MFPARAAPVRISSLPAASYAYLLGLYLGDGWIVAMRRGTFSLRISLDQRYPGLIHSDGCRFVANQRVGGKTYRYSRYSFSYRSEDIKAIFCDHLDLLGIRWTRPNRDQIAIDRRGEVAKLDSFVGPKR